MLIHFAPLSTEAIPIPGDWAFLIAHSLMTAEKSGEVRAQYNARRTEGAAAIARLGFHSYREAVEHYTFDELRSMFHVPKAVTPEAELP